MFVVHGNPVDILKHGALQHLPSALRREKIEELCSFSVTSVKLVSPKQWGDFRGS